jgi:hypothetical protein
MNLGHNSNVQVGSTAFHVQTEDRGSGHPFIDTIVYSGGRVVHRRTTNYADLLNSGGDCQALLQKRVEEQHRGVIDEIRAGVLELPLSPAPAEVSTGLASSLDGVTVNLLNAASWVQKGHANLQIEVRARDTSQPRAGAAIFVVLEGALSPVRFEASTNADGYVEVKFPMPKIGSAGGVLVISAFSGSATDQIRYQLKSKPRTPAAPSSVS